MNFLMAILHKFDTLQKIFSLAGIWGVITFIPVQRSLTLFLSKLGVELKNKQVKLRLKGYDHPVWLRYGTDDFGIFYQIFLAEEYSGLHDLKNPNIVIDCGAYVGFSSIYFLNKYPKIRALAIEPDSENFKVCEKNLSYYKERVALLNTAIWSHQTQLRVCKDDGRGECEIQVYECQESQKPEIYSIDMESLLNKFDLRSIDILKIDIEGAETAIFSHNYESWLNKVRNIAIELHGEECEEKFFKALSRYDYDLSNSGELTICQRISPKTTSISGAVFH